MWPFGRSKQSPAVRQWAAATSSGKTIGVFRVRKTATGYTMTYRGADGQEQPFPDSSKGHYSTVALAYEAMIGYCASLVYVVWDATISERESGVKSKIQEPKIVHIVELFSDVDRAMPLAQIMIEDLDLVRGDFADPTTREPIDPARATTLATARPQ